MTRPTYLPNLLSSLRIALAPAMLAAAYSNSKVGFSVLLGAALVSDAVDGVIARRWRAQTELGARLDRWGDGLTAGLAVVGVYFLWPQLVEREWRWVLLAIAGYALTGFSRLLHPASAAARPASFAKALTWVLPISLWPLVQEIAAWPFQAGAALQFAIGLGRVCVSRRGVVEEAKLTAQEAGS